MATKSKQHSIYILDREKAIEVLFKDELDSGRDSESFSMEEIVNAIMRNNDGYKKQALQFSDYQGYRIELYYKNDPPRLSPLASFCSSFANASAAVCSSKMSFDSSVMFVWKDQNLFMVPTGQGYHAIEDYLFTRFGIIIAYQCEFPSFFQPNTRNTINLTVYYKNTL